jgi:hypothetical protein
MKHTESAAHEDNCFCGTDPAYPSSSSSSVFLNWGLGVAGLVLDLRGEASIPWNRLDWIGSRTTDTLCTVSDYGLGRLLRGASAITLVPFFCFPLLLAESFHD